MTCIEFNGIISELHQFNENKIVTTQRNGLTGFSSKTKSIVKEAGLT